MNFEDAVMAVLDGKDKAQGDSFWLTYSGYPTAKQDWYSDDVRDKYEVAND